MRNNSNDKPVTVDHNLTTYSTSNNNNGGYEEIGCMYHKIFVINMTIDYTLLCFNPFLLFDVLLFFVF